MTADGDASKTYQWTWDGAVDADTFSVSKAGVEITNAVSDGDYSMDINTLSVPQRLGRHLPHHHYRPEGRGPSGHPAGQRLHRHQDR